MKHAPFLTQSNKRIEDKYPSLEDLSKKNYIKNISITEQNSTTNSSSLIINDFLLGKSVEVLRALKHNLRRRILSYIHSKGNVCVTDIYVTLGLTQSDASQHLRVLRNIDVVQTRRAQKQVFYSVNYDRLRKIHLHIKNFVE
jgi:ArsR family transcriptional regulator, virulence genes transcriptional regulator